MLRGERRQGEGRRAAVALFGSRAVRWHVAQQQDNIGAQRFWRTLIDAYTPMVISSRGGASVSPEGSRQAPSPTTDEPAGYPSESGSLQAECYTPAEPASSGSRGVGEPRPGNGTHGSPHHQTLPMQIQQIPPLTTMGPSVVLLDSSDSAYG